MTQHEQSTIGAVSMFLYDGPDAPAKHTISRAHYYQSEDVALPMAGITAMYGYRGASNVLRHALRSAVADDRFMAQVNFRVRVGEWNPNKQQLSDLESCRFLNIPNRASADLMDDINKRWNDWLALEGKPSEKFPRSPSKNMHLLDKLIQIEPYSQLNAIAYDVRTTVGLAKFITVFNLDAIDREDVAVIPGGETEIGFEVPAGV